MKHIICLLLLLLTIQKGISQNWSHIYGSIKVLDVAEQQNHIWVATDRGLFQINKTTLESTHYNKNNSLLTQDHVQTLAVDQMGSLWIGTYDLILLRVNSNGVWSGFNYPSSILGTPLTGNLVYCSAVDNNGTVWLGSARGLMSFDGNTWGLETYSTYPIWDMTIDNQNKIHTASFNLLSFDINNSTWTEEHHPANPSGIMAYSDGRIVLENDTTCFFFPDHGNAFGAAHRFQNGNWTSWNNAAGQGGNPMNLPIDPNGSHLSVSKNGNQIYYNTHSDLLGHFNGSQWVIDSSIAQQNTGLEYVDYCFVSANGDYWAFEGAQLVKYNNNTTTTGELMPIVGFNYATKLLEDRNDAVYLTSYNDGIRKFEQGVWTTLPGSTTHTNYGITHFDGNNNAWYVSRNNNSDVSIIEQNSAASGGWILHDNTTTTGGLFPTANGAYFYDMGVSSNNVVLVRDNLDVIYKYQNNTWSIIASPANPATILASEMASDHLGNLWWMERVETSPNNYTYSLKKFDGNSIQSTPTSSIGFTKPYLDENGDLWTAFGTGEIRKYNGSSWTVYNFTPSNARAYNITGRNNTLYITTQDDGLLEFDGTNWTVYNTSNSPLTSNELRQLALGNNGSLWMTNDEGNIIDIYETGLATSTTKISTEEKTSVHIYPNPSSDLIRIESSAQNIQSIQIFNTVGHLVYQSNKNSNTINISELPTGLYWVLVNEKERGSFVKNF